MMKKISVFLCLLLCFALLTACKGNDEESSSSSNAGSSESEQTSPLAGQWRRGGSDLIELKSDGTFTWSSDYSDYDNTGTWDDQKITLSETRWYDIVDAGKNVMHIRWMNDEKAETIYRTGSNALVGKWTLKETNGDSYAPSIFKTAGSMQENKATFILEFGTDGFCKRTYSVMRNAETSDNFSYGVEGSDLYMFSNGEKIGFQIDGDTLTLTEDSYSIKLTKSE